MRTIRIEKDRILLEPELKEPKELTPFDIPNHLGDLLEIGEDVTFGRIFEIILDNAELFNIIFKSHTRGFDIFQYIRDYEKEHDKEETEIEWLEVYRVFEHSIYRDGEVDYQYYYGFHGVGFEDKEGRRTNYSIMGLSLAELKNIEIRTNNELNITIDTGLSFRAKDFKWEDKYKHLHTAQIPMTIFNYFGAILFEITYSGYPEDREKRNQELMDQVKEIDEKLERGEEVGHEMHWDEDDEPYFIIDGKKKYLLKDLDDDEETE